MLKLEMFTIITDIAVQDLKEQPPNTAGTVTSDIENSAGTYIIYKIKNYEN